MKKVLTNILALLLLPWITATASAQDEGTVIERPVLSAYTIEAGSSHLAETYLSPLRYSGWNFALGYERMQAMRFNPGRWVMQLHGHLRVDNTTNPRRNAHMWNLDLELGWGMQRRFRLDNGWSFFAGGSTDIDAGVIYNPRNSNNPVAVKASWTVGLLGAAAYNGSFRGLPYCLRYQASMPLTGVFFSPAYGELYYEIYMGNHSGLARCAWPGNFFRLNNLLTADLRFGRTTLRLGYRCDIHSSKASHIVTRHIDHSAVVGIVSEWITLSAKPRLDNVKIINALY